jgi:zinc/manganese transport system permease protein
VDPESARAKGVPIKALDYAFLVLLAATTVVSIEATGVLLAFALISAPAGAAHRLTRNPGLSFIAAQLLGLGITWSGIALAFFGPWSRIPVGVYIATFSALVYGLALLRDRFRVRSRPEAHRHSEREIHE